MVLITDREKTLVDCADDVDRAGGIEELVKAVKAASREIRWQKLNSYVQRFPNRSVRKRLGFLFESAVRGLTEDAKDILAAWQKELSAGISPLSPSGRKSGRVLTRWRLRVNAEIG